VKCSSSSVLALCNELYIFNYYHSYFEDITLDVDFTNSLHLLRPVWLHCGVRVSFCRGKIIRILHGITFGFHNNKYIQNTNKKDFPILKI